jgi:tetratricopeptide (TPR) repeat protein
LQKKGDALSVNVRLISAKNGQVLWTSQNFERPINSAFELQDVISCNVANELGAELCGIIAQHPRRYTKNADAYQNYLQGRFHWNKRTGEGIKKSIEFYEKAIKADANFAPAYAGLAESYVQGIWHVPFASKEVLPKAMTAALKAVELDNTLSEAHTALGSVYGLEWNFAEARRELQRAVELNPRNARAFHVQAFAFHVVGRNDEAVQSIERAFELDPLNLVVNTDRAQLLFIAGRTDEAFAQWQKTVELDPNFSLAHEHLATAYQISGNEKAAIEENVKVMQLGGQSAEKINLYRQTVEKFGLKEIFRKDLKDLLEKEKRGEKISNISAAILNTWLGQTDEAFKYLEKAFLEHDAQMLLLPSPIFSALRSDSRYQDLLKRANLAE